MILGTNPLATSNLRLRWSFPPDQWQLNGADVHIWAANLDKSAEVMSALKQTLSLDERNRLERIYSEAHRHRFVAGRGILRAILGSYLKIDPAQVGFVYSSRGKPTLTGVPKSHALHFNVSHSNNLILIAVTRVSAVGIDVEWIHSISDAENIACYFFSPREATELMNLPKELRVLSFLSLWTRKEACLKAIGAGLSELAEQIEVSFLPGEPARVLAISGDPQAAMCWSLVELSPASEFKAAVAAAAKNLRFFCWQWPF
jgi:4'-phosphopantetheinyl transferase